MRSLRLFCVELFTVENVLFYVDARAYKKLPAESRLAEAHRIFNEVCTCAQCSLTHATRGGSTVRSVPRLKSTSPPTCASAWRICLLTVCLEMQLVTQSYGVC